MIPKAALTLIALCAYLSGTECTLLRNPRPYGSSDRKRWDPGWRRWDPDWWRGYQDRWRWDDHWEDSSREREEIIPTKEEDVSTERDEIGSTDEPDVYRTSFRYTPRDNVTFWGSGWMDRTGNFDFGLNFRYQFRKRSVHLPKERFYLRIEASPCQFEVYDRNSDGLITMEEVQTVFPDFNLAEKLFLDLDITTGDNVVTRDEFNFMASKIITGCYQKPTTPLTPLPAAQREQESRESATEEGVTSEEQMTA